MTKVAEFSNSFLKNLKTLEHKKKEQVKIKIKQLLLDPKIGIPLKGTLRPLWKLRVGKYRVLYKFDKEKVYFVVLDLRKRAYKY